MKKGNVILISNLLILRKYENSWQRITDKWSSLRSLKKSVLNIVQFRILTMKGNLTKKHLLWVVPEGICMECQWEKTRCPKKVFNLLLHTHSVEKSLKKVPFYNMRVFAPKLNIKICYWSFFGMKIQIGQFVVIFKDCDK